ncbi:PQQ-binding-like beta-propeller repeat protein [Sphingomonas lutea]|uniref:PQQ-binding-like beta-propeller repeat protein n=1 Tax=Sphingomonas lutea TaxID=1045317 RepID=A0A7G9SHL5_9SPHN|nr:PQQ-binding-like beta-propeller repeat protein [Sphingomonas lutea]QNN67340.1 PQQ-binding-like beta-propeller repeat protein [Sphingomonas lutea]
MIKSDITRFFVIATAALAVSGCGIIKKSTPKTPVLGERIAVLTADSDVQVDPATTALPMSLPPATVNSEWTQSGGNATKSMGHLALGNALTRAFTVNGGRGSTLTARLASEPVVAGGRVYTIDILGTVRAFDTRNGGLLWASQTPNDRGNEASLYGGGIAFNNGRIYATNGLGYVAALDVTNGGIVWQVRPGGPLRGAPTVADGALYVISQDNQIFSLRESDGRQNWSQPASLEIAGIFGSAAPAVGQGTVVAGFSSGELNAYRYENGRQVWQDALQPTSIRTSVSSLSDIDADPVIDNGQVIAVGQGGRMVALELTTGQRIWEVNISGISTPWVAPEWIFVVTADAKLLCLSRATGRVRWINQLPQFERPGSKRGQIDYSGPILAGDRLIVAGSNGVLVNVDPVSGSFQSQTRVSAGINLSPIVADSTLFVFDNDGQLHAFR